MPETDLDFLAFASSFSRFAGPNNPLLDLGNYLTREMRLRFALVTTTRFPDPDFAGYIAFPVYRELSGWSSAVLERLSYGPSNILRARGAIARLRPRSMMVFSSLDTAFEVAWATGGPVLLGHNVLLNEPHREWANRLGEAYRATRSWKRPLFEALDGIASRMILRGILAHSQFHKEMYLAMGIAEDRIRIVPHCIDLKRMDHVRGVSPSRETEETSILFVGNLEPVKGVTNLVRAAIVASREIPLVLQFRGDGSLKGYLQTLRGERISSGHLRIEILPRLSFPDLVNSIRQADMVTIPSHYEPFGMVALEAMALGKPTIATRYGGISEIIRHMRDGVLIDPFDCDGFAQGIIEIAGNDSLRRQLGTSARQRALAEYDVSVVAPRFLRALEELA